MNHLLFPGSEGCLGDDDNALLLWGLWREKEQYERGHGVVPGKQCVTNLSRNRDARLRIYLYPFFVTNCHKISSQKTDHRMDLSLISWLSFGNFHSCNLHQIQSRFYLPLDQWLVFNRLVICPSSVFIRLFSAPQLRGVHQRDDGGQAQGQLRHLHRGRGHRDGGACYGGCVRKNIQQDDWLSEVS